MAAGSDALAHLMKFTGPRTDVLGRRL